ncbi:MAG: putative membrane protein [Cenarchaeum symbiont of Oopsacas minuta]|nr:putative membrane protein [Cenarchaeum symbiont of Oopsacas minuta]
MVNEVEESEMSVEENYENSIISIHDKTVMPTITEDRSNLKNKLFSDIWVTINKSISESRINDEMYAKILTSFIQLMNMLERENGLNYHTLKELKHYRAMVDNIHVNNMDFQDIIIKDLNKKYQNEHINSKELSKIFNVMANMQDQISKLSANNSQNVTLDQKNVQSSSKLNIRTKAKTGKSLYAFLALCGIGALTLVATTPFPINIILPIIAGSPIILAIISKLKS